MGIPNIVSLHPKQKSEINICIFTPEKETVSIPFTLIWDSLPRGPQRRLDVEELRREIIIAQGYDRENRKRVQVGRGEGIKESSAIKGSYLAK